MYFIAIVSQSDQLNGIIRPSYVLKKTNSMSDRRSGFFVTRENSTRYESQPKVLVRRQTGNEALLAIMTHYRTRDHRHVTGKESTVENRKYFPKGALFYFECDEYGRQTGPAVFVKMVPDKSITKMDQGWNQFRELSEYVPTIPELLSGYEHY